MTIHKLVRYGAIAVASLGLAGGVAMASSGTLSNTGPQSRNDVNINNHSHVDLTNTNKVGVDNKNNQNASSGDAKVNDNTTGGSATSGDASVDNTSSTSLTLSNSDCGCSLLEGMGSGSDDASIDTTGPQSHNNVTIDNNNSLNVKNSNTVNVNNSNWQSAKSGKASVSDNTTGGDATSGSATASNSSSTDLNL